jgi:hypothetical protein
MAPIRRSGASTLVARRDGTAAEVVGTTALGSKESEDNILLKSEIDKLKSIIDVLNGKIASGTSGDESGIDTMQKITQKELNEGQKASVGAYVSSIYKRLKFLNNETHEAYPNVLQKALGQLVIVRVNETQESYRTATLKEMRYQISQRRQYSKKQIMKKYLGMCQVKQGNCS